MAKSMKRRIIGTPLGWGAALAFTGGIVWWMNAGVVESGEFRENIFGRTLRWRIRKLPWNNRFVGEVSNNGIFWSDTVGEVATIEEARDSVGVVG